MFLQYFYNALNIFFFGYQVDMRGYTEFNIGCDFPDIKIKIDQISELESNLKIFSIPGTPENKHYLQKGTTLREINFGGHFAKRELFWCLFD